MIQIDMDMPTSCRCCPFRDRDGDCCILFSFGVVDRYRVHQFEERPYWCGLGEVTE